MRVALVIFLAVAIAIYAFFFHTNFLASNASEDMLHDLTDYAIAVPAFDGDLEKIGSLLNGEKSRVYDLVSKNRDAYFFRVYSENSGVTVTSGLTVVLGNQSPSSISDSYVAGTVAGAKKSGVVIYEIPCSRIEYDSCQYFAMSKNSVPIGNYFVLRKNKNIYEVTIIGLGALHNSKNIESFLLQKADKLLVFKPELSSQD